MNYPGETKRPTVSPYPRPNVFYPETFPSFPPPDPQSAQISTAAVTRIASNIPDPVTVTDVINDAERARASWKRTTPAWPTAPYPHNPARHPSLNPPPLSSTLVTTLFYENTCLFHVIVLKDEGFRFPFFYLFIWMKKTCCYSDLAAAVGVPPLFSSHGVSFSFHSAFPCFFSCSCWHLNPSWISWNPRSLLPLFSFPGIEFKNSEKRKKENRRRRKHLSKENRRRRNPPCREPLWSWISSALRRRTLPASGLWSHEDLLEALYPILQLFYPVISLCARSLSLSLCLVPY